MPATLDLLAATGIPPVRRRHLDTRQANLGCRCTLGKLDGHVAAGPSHTDATDAARAVGAVAAGVR